MPTLNQYGLTCSWTGGGATGIFANGDYWVVGPIVVTGFTPLSVIGNTIAYTGIYLNGAMINPSPGQYPGCGFDSRIIGYDESLNVGRKGGNPISPTNTLTVPVNSSLCLSSSRTGSDGGHALLLDFAVLTVLSSGAPSGSFRPPYVGSGNKDILWNKSQLDYTILKNYAPVAGMSQPTSAGFTRPWVEIAEEYNNARDWRPYNNQPEYDRDCGYQVQSALLELHQNYTNAQKETGYVRIVQYGIDMYAAMRWGKDVVNSVTYDTQSNNTFQKGPVVLAALALNDTGIKYYANAANTVFNPYIGGGAIPCNRFGIDSAISYVLPDFVGRSGPDQYLTEGRMRLPYTSGMIGLPEWGFDNNLITTSCTAASNWSVIYRNVRYPGLVGQALAMQLVTGAKALWNWPATFDWFDRAFVTYVNGPADPTEEYIRLFWSGYRASGNPIWPQAAPVAGVGWVPESGDAFILEETDNTTYGAGGNGGLILSATNGPVIATYSGGQKTTQSVYSISRRINSGETVTYSYTQPGNGLEASYNALDVLSVTANPVVNYSFILGTGGGGSSGYNYTVRRIGKYLRLFGPSY